MTSWVATKTRRVGSRVLRIVRGAPSSRYEQLTLTPRGTTLEVSGRTASSLLVEGLVLRAGKKKLAHLKQESASPFAFDLDLAELAASGRVSAADLFLVVRDAGASDSREVRLGNFVDTDRDAASGSIEVAGTKAWVHVTGQGNVSIHFGAAPVVRTKFTTTRLQCKPSGISFEIEVKTYSRPVESVEVVFSHRQSNRDLIVPITWDDSAERRRAEFGLHTGYLRGEISPELLGITEKLDLNHDLKVHVTLAEVDVPLKRGIKQPKRRVRSSLREVVVRGDNTVQVYAPYLTMTSRSLAFWGETHSADNFRYMQRLRWTAWMFALVRPFRQVWLVGETPEKAEDNGFHFFRWMRTQHPRRNVYYVIESDSPHRAHVEPFGNVVERFSREHIKLTLMASRYVCSHHAENLWASRMPFMQRRSRGLRVFLQHGVTGAKNVIGMYGRRSYHSKPADYFCVNSELEKQIVVQDFVFFPSQVPITGFTRFDALLAGDVEKQNMILIMPTWRDWLANEASFMSSEYLARWTAFLRHPRLHELREKHGVRVAFILHPNLRRYTDRFDVPGVDVIRPGEIGIQELMKQASILVTDYSSVGWDFSFLDRPVHFFQFDRRRQDAQRGEPHIDHETQLPGPISMTEDELVERIAANIDDGFTVSDDYRRRSRAFLDHPDQLNCQRTYDLVRKGATLKALFLRRRNTPFWRDAYQDFRYGRWYPKFARFVFVLGTMLPKKNLIVFESDRARRWGDSPRAIYERLVERGSSYDIMVANNTTARMSDFDTEKLRRNSPRYLWRMGRAKFWVTNQNQSPFITTPQRTTFVQTWHGTPLKRMQHDVDEMHGRTEKYHEEADRLTSQWSVLLSPSDYATAAFRSAFHFDKRIVQEGYPRNDMFFADDREERAAVVKRRLALPHDKKIVLYAPTFRDDKRSGVGYWNADMKLDLAEMKRKLGDRYVLLVRFHAVVGQKFVLDDDLHDFVYDVSAYPETQELLLASDVLITDYSSLMFDFATLERPLLFFTYDLEHYRDTLRGFYLDFEAEAPGPLLYTSDDVVATLDDLDAVEAEYGAKVSAFKATYGPQEDGHASDRVIDALFGDAVIS